LPGDTQVATHAMKMIYYSLYGLFIIVAFVAMPYAYFYYEDGGR
jgi:hypothetical protein